jgi:hypothetical protein
MDDGLIMKEETKKQTNKNKSEGKTKENKKKLRKQKGRNETKKVRRKMERKQGNKIKKSAIHVNTYQYSQTSVHIQVEYPYSEMRSKARTSAWEC